jgi:hypothetical protein
VRRPARLLRNSTTHLVEFISIRKTHFKTTTHQQNAGEL